MTGVVVSIDKYRFTRKPSNGGVLLKGECGHFNMLMDADGHHIKCEDCNTQLSAYWVLERMLTVYERERARVKAQRVQLDKDRAGDITRIAARVVDKAWRSHSMVPSCPHCHEAIFPQDGFGRSNVNKEIALQRRKARRP